MNRFITDAALLVSAGALLIVVGSLFHCRHNRELFDRYPNGRPALRCANCLRMRPNVLQTEPHYRLTQPGGPIARPETGIHRIWAELDHPITDAELFDAIPADVHLERRASIRHEPVEIVPAKRA
ncbi:MAG TPA: hypothetical protein VIC54_10705 [Terriglobales bacterium]|jgi:hypothetical protein